MNQFDVAHVAACVARVSPPQQRRHATVKPVQKGHMPV